MAGVDEFLQGLLAFLGPVGVLVALFLVFVIDAAIFPALPELAVVLAYSYSVPGLDPLLWTVLLVLMAVAGEAVGNSTLYLLVKRAIIGRGHMPKSLERMMRRYVDFLIVRDERIILVNRVAPVVPFVGAFIATCGWDYRKSLAYIVSGAAVKYTALLVLVAYVGIVYDPGTARWVTVGLILAIVGLSAIASFVYRRRMRISSKSGR